MSYRAVGAAATPDDLDPEILADWDMFEQLDFQLSDPPAIRQQKCVDAGFYWNKGLNVCTQGQADCGARGGKWENGICHTGRLECGATGRGVWLNGRCSATKGKCDELAMAFSSTGPKQDGEGWYAPVWLRRQSPEMAAAPGGLPVAAEGYAFDATGKTYCWGTSKLAKQYQAGPDNCLRGTVLWSPQKGCEVDVYESPMSSGTFAPVSGLGDAEEPVARGYLTPQNQVLPTPGGTYTPSWIGPAALGLLALGLGALVWKQSKEPVR